VINFSEAGRHLGGAFAQSTRARLLAVWQGVIQALSSGNVSDRHQKQGHLVAVKTSIESRVL